MEQIIYVYNKDLIIIAQPYITNLEEFKENPTKFYPDWDNTMYATLEKYNNPILDKKTGEIREKTREEKILLDKKLDLLADGEYLENGEIKEIKYIKELGYYRPVWDKELHIWEEGTTREEFIEMRKNKILEYSKLEEEKRIFENTKFPSENEVEVIIEKMAILEADINNLQEKIKLL